MPTKEPNVDWPQLASITSSWPDRTAMAHEKTLRRCLESITLCISKHSSPVILELRPNGDVQLLAYA